MTSKFPNPEVWAQDLIEKLEAENVKLRAALEAAPPIDGSANALEYLTWYATTRKEALR